MALVPLLDLRPKAEAGDAEAREGIIPVNIEAEQALLGILLYESEQFWQLPIGLTATAFFEPFHGRLFNSIKACLSAGLSADPIMLSHEFVADPAFKILGGIEYLANLVEHAPPVVNAPNYARIIIEMFTRRRLIDIAKTLVQEAQTTEQVDGGSAAVIANLESDLLGLALADTRFELVDSQASSAAVMAAMDDRAAPAGVLSGLAPLDLQLGPMVAGDLIVLGGRPSMGKSALSSAMASRIAAPEWWADQEGTAVFGGSAKVPERAGVIIINGEMSVEQMTRRFLADIGFQMFGRDFPTSKDMRDRKFSDAQRKMVGAAAAVFSDMPIKTMKRSGMKISQVRSICRRQVSQWARAGIRTGAVIIDHVGLMKADGKTSGRYEAQTEIAMETKVLADELECVLLALVQLSRKLEDRNDKHPMMSDLRDSGSWEESADAVIFPFREAYYAALEPEPKGDGEKWNDWSKRKHSRSIEADIPKLREGGGGRKALLWGALDWNVIRGAEPSNTGGLV